MNSQAHTNAVAHCEKLVKDKPKFNAIELDLTMVVAFPHMSNAAMTKVYDDVGILRKMEHTITVRNAHYASLRPKK